MTVKNYLSIFEHERIYNVAEGDGPNGVPAPVFKWFDDQSVQEDGLLRKALTPSRSGGRRAVKVGSYAGIVQGPGRFHLEVLPKIGKATDQAYARRILLGMLRTAPGFKHIQSWPADLAVNRMPLLEVFIGRYLTAVELIAKRGLRSTYVAQNDNLACLRGKLQIGRHIRRNTVRRDRFFAEYDEFLADRPENRILHAALRIVSGVTMLNEHQRKSRELLFIFAEVPASTDVIQDLRRIRLERGASYYRDALDWARLILQGLSPSVGLGQREAPSLLFPMDALFEAHVERHLARQLADGYRLKRQARIHNLVRHLEHDWFFLQPDLLIQKDGKNHVLLDAKWKLLDKTRGNREDKYDLSQDDFYQLYAYGRHYLAGQGDMVLIYPKTDLLTEALPVFSFPQEPELRLWVIPFCLDTHRLLIPEVCGIRSFFIA